MIILIFLMNIIDLCFTLYWINIEVATEANPLLNFLLTLGLGYFISFKILISSIGLIILNKYKYLALAKQGIYLTFGYYLVLIIYHLAYL
jgi:hypothetical protein